MMTIAGTGSNSTSEAISLTKFAEDAGADAALLITPYYNKPQQHALIEHYRSVSQATDIPIIAYNVPSRTGINMDVETIVELAKIDNIDAVKEASGSVDKVSDNCAAAKTEFFNLAGEQLMQPASSGVYVKRTTTADGKVTTKVIGRP